LGKGLFSVALPIVFGGGMYGHLVLFLTTTKYPMLSNTPFVHLVNPGPLDRTEKVTEVQINSTFYDRREFHHALSATAKLTTTRAKLPSQTCLETVHKGAISWNNDNLGCQTSEI